MFFVLGLTIGTVVGFSFCGLLFWPQTRNLLDDLEDHKDEIIALLATTVYVGGCLSLIPNDPDLFVNARIPELIAAVGFGVGLSKAGRGLKDKLDTNS